MQRQTVDERVPGAQGTGTEKVLLFPGCGVSLLQDEESPRHGCSSDKVQQRECA